MEENTIPERELIPLQTIRVFGQAETPAYERTVSMREVMFTCVVCQQQMTQLRYPGPLPRYCSPDCRAVQAQVLNQERVRKQREKRWAAREAHEKASSTDHSSRIEMPSLPSLRPLLASKLSPPRLPTLLVERSRLLTQLDGALLHTLTLLQAPAGFGKTTVVNQWIAACSTHGDFSAVAWVSLDAGDNDLIRFWRYVMTACLTLQGQEKRGPGQATLALLSSVGQPPFVRPSMEEVLTLLLNDLIHQGQGVLLVLDDYHTITEPRIHETLTFFLDHLPKTVRVLLLSRAEPPLPLLRWRARGELCELQLADLRFSSEETAAFLHQALPTPLSDAALTQLDTSLEGWAAGLRLLALALQRRKTSHAIEQTLFSLSERSGSFSPHYRLLLDYFVTEILETQPEPMQRFLLHTSVHRRLCAPLCDAVTASEGGSAQLEAVARAGLFLEALEGPGEWYRYHALFAEAMRREASRRLGEETLQEGALRASLWYEQEGMLTEAIEAAWLALDMERVARLIEQIDVLNFYEPQTMRRWLEQLPEAVLHEHPMLCHLFAVELRFPVELRFSAIPASELTPLSEVERSRIETLLQMAEEGWRRRGMLAWIGANRAFCALSILVNQEPFPALVDYAQQALVFLPQEGALDRRLQMYRGSCLLFVGIEKLRLGQVSEARQLLLQAQEDNVPPGNKYLATDIRLALGKCHLLQGELKLASRHLRQVFSEARELGDDEVVTDALLELAWLAFEWNDLVGAERQAREAQALAQRVHPQRQEFSDRVALQLALLQHVQGETTAALEQVTARLSGSQRAWTSDSFWLLSRLRDWQGRLRIVTGDVQAVQESLQAPSQSSEMASITDHLGAEILRGRLWLAQGKVEAALQQFTRLLPLAQESLHQYSALEVELLLALASAACQQEQQAHSWLRQALMQAVPEDYIRLFLNEGKPMILLLRSLLKSLPYDTTLRSYIQRILRAVPHAPRSRLARAEEDGLLFEPLSPQEQRVLRLLVAGWSNQEIARELVVSVNTVKYHTKHLYQKLGVSNRLQASSAARVLSLDTGDQ